MTAAAPAPDAFRHEALLYAGRDELVDRVAGFARDGVEAGEPVLVVLAGPRLDRVRSALGAAASRVQFADMADVGANPGRIISAWRAFVDASPPDVGVRGVGEPIWAERQGEELVECHRHEALLNVAFDGGRAWWLICPYDTTTLSPAVIEQAQVNHPLVRHDGSSRRSDVYVDPATSPQLPPLPPAPADAPRLRFDAATLPAVRALVSRSAARAGFGSAQVADLAMAANEVAENSLRHGGGSGIVQVWRESDTVICEISDSGVLAVPLAGRVAPGAGIDEARGLWLANALCDLVQLRSSDAGTAVRLHLGRRRALRTRTA
jgi:anti-sigma regulatory factor (Ser/Thr protein kinase)